MKKIKTEGTAQKRGFLQFLKNNGIYLVSGVVLGFLLWLTSGFVQ